MLSPSVYSGFDGLAGIRSSAWARAKAVYDINKT